MTLRFRVAVKVCIIQIRIFCSIVLYVNFFEHFKWEVEAYLCSHAPVFPCIWFSLMKAQRSRNLCENVHYEIDVYRPIDCTCFYLDLFK